MNIDKAKEIARKKLPKKRYIHSKQVAETAVQMARIFDANEEKCYLAGILHDYAKYDDLKDMYRLVKEYSLDYEYLEYGTAILHGPIAALMMREKYGMHDIEILHAIENHTSGRKNMSLVERIIYVADYIEPGRTTPGVNDIRQIIFEEHNLNKAVFIMTKRNILHLIENERAMFSRTIECYNYYNTSKGLIY